jgi:biopolymer transport protein ExbB
MLARSQPTRRALAALALALAAVALPLPRARAISGEELLKRARASRQAAETNLAEARKRHLAEREALAAELQKAYAELSSARAEARAAQATAKGLEGDLAALDRSAALTAHRTVSLIAQAASASGAEIDPNVDAAGLEETLWRGLADRLQRLEADSRIDVARRSVVTRSGQEAHLPVLRLGSYCAYACGPGRESCGLLRALPDGREVIVGPYLAGPHAEALRAAAAGRVSHLPVDVDGTLIDRAPAEPKGLRSWLAAGGPFIYPILAVGALGLLLIADRVHFLLRAKASPAIVNDALSRLGRGDAAAAREALGTPRTPTARVLLAGTDAAGKPVEQREAAMESALLAEAPKLERSLSLLGALAGVAPLLGLLGTVSGMIATFDTISAAGTGNPRLLSGGISEALITTQLGLMVAIPLLLAHAWLSRWVQRREAMLEYHAIQAFGIQRGTGEEQGAP